MKSPLQQHCEKWAKGCGSEYCAKARRVFCRGTIPCDILLVGEGPWISEDTLGVPFAGPAGNDPNYGLNRIISASISPPLTYAITNLICCISRDVDGKKEDPSDVAVKLCQPRLAEFIQLAQPKLIVAVGTMARDWLDPKRKGSLKLDGSNGDGLIIPTVDILHPAFILRPQVTVANKGLLTMRSIIKIQDAIQEYLQ